MENIALKTNESTGTLPAMNKLGGASFAISFANLLNTTRIEDAGSLYANRTDITSNKAEAPAPDRPRDDGGERREAKVENTDRPDAPQAPRPDSRDDGPAPVRESYGDEPRDDGAPREKDQAHGGEAGDDGSKQDENGPAADKTSRDDGRTLAAGESVITPGNETATEAAQQVLAGLMAGAEDGGKQNHVAAQASERATAAPQRVNALDGLARASDAVGKQTPTGGGNAGQANANTHGNQAKGIVQQAQAPADAKGADEAASKAAGDSLQQALAKKIGDGARVQVNVVKEAAVLSSRPSATLAQASTQAADGGTKPQSGQAATHGNAPSAAGPQAGQAGQQALGNVAVQQAVQQAQAALQGGGGKGAAQGTLHVNAGQATEGGTLSATVPGAEARQAGQAKQAANTGAPSQPRPSVADQVTVQITKALQSGVDKITIQLRPAFMGRIDVQMEIASDGRTSIVITADNRDTLDLLQRDARYLEQALKDAGLQADAGNMEFNMREGQESDGEDGGKSDSSDTATADASDASEQDLPVLDGYIVGPDGRVDIRA